MSLYITFPERKRNALLVCSSPPLMITSFTTYLNINLPLQSSSKGRFIIKPASSFNSWLKSISEVIFPSK
uniref:Ovule protein n=1 Tax=Brugia timori TaxID=42155 RepID=A0A0R3QG42_9BILA